MEIPILIMMKDTELELVIVPGIRMILDTDVATVLVAVDTIIPEEGPG